MPKEEALNRALLLSPQAFAHLIPSEKQELNSSFFHRSLDCLVVLQEKILNI